MKIRGRIDSHAARVRALGVRGVLDIESDTFGRIVRATVAATAAWEAAALLNSPRPVLASLGAILVVQVTVRASLARSIQLTIGVVAGLAISALIAHYLGTHWWTIALVVLGGLIFGEVLRLGPFSSQAAISALLAFSLGSGYGWLRVVDTFVGALIGVAVNTLVAPPSSVAEGVRSLRRVAEDFGALLGDMGRGMAERPTAAAVERWLDRARDVSADLRRAADDLDQAEESIRYNHRGRGSARTLERATEARLALEHSAHQIRGIARSLTELIPAGTEPDHEDDEASPEDETVAAVLSLLGPMLIHVGHAVSAYGRLQENPSSAPDREDSVDAIAAAQEDQAGVADALADLDTHGATSGARSRLLGAMLVDCERLLHEVDGHHGAHASAVTTSVSR